jgi:hypothetical protein
VSVTPPSGRKSHLETTPNTVPHLCCSPSILPPAETPTRATETMHRTQVGATKYVSDLPTSQTPSQTSARSPHHRFQTPLIYIDPSEPCIQLLL